MTDKDAVAALFKFFDDDDSQGLTLEELKAGMISVGSTISETEVKDFFNKYDTDKNGIIDFKEFLGLCMDLNTNESEKAIAQLFQAVDQNGDRTLSNEELRIGIANYTGKPLEDKELNDLIKQVRRDISRSHNISRRLLEELYAPSIGVSPQRTPKSVRRVMSSGSNS